MSSDPRFQSRGVASIKAIRKLDSRATPADIRELCRIAAELQKSETAQLEACVTIGNLAKHIGAKRAGEWADLVVPLMCSIFKTFESSAVVLPMACWAVGRLMKYCDRAVAGALVEVGPVIRRAAAEGFDGGHALRL